MMTLATFFLRPRDASQQLEASVRILLIDRLHAQYSIEGQQLDGRERDAEGLWYVTINEPKDFSSRLEKSGFMPALASDEQDLRRVVNEAHIAAENADAYEFFRNEVALGSESICETLPCNISIGVAPTRKQIVIAISKT